MRGRWFLLLAPIAVIVAAAVLLNRQSGAGAPAYKLAAVERGAVVNAVSATGTLRAVVTVQVGSQISGQIMELNADFNTKVSKDEVIARLNPENLEARVHQSEAELAVARASLLQQQAAVVRAEADLRNAQASAAATSARAKSARITVADADRDLKRALDLFDKKVVAKAQVETAQGAYDKAVAQRDAAVADEAAQESAVAARAAQLEMAKAEVEIAKAQVTMREAALQSDLVNLDHTYIRSPVDGVVIERSVDIGQTVAASLQAPTLFTIAQDLSQMQVEVNVNEADIGSALVGQHAAFTVDAYPEREFTGTVRQIRLAPQTVQNVVTYKVIVAADNPEGVLLPGMTADVRIIMSERRNVLRVPNAALRFRPAQDEGGGQTVAVAANANGAAVQGARAAANGLDLDQLTRDLELTPEQQDRIRAELASLRERFATQRGQEQTPGGGPPEGGPAAAFGGAPPGGPAGGGQGRNGARAGGQALQRAIAAVLTPEQLAKFRALQGARPNQNGAAPLRPARLFVVGADGKAAPVEVQVGLADAGYTELAPGALEPGAKVVVGLDQPVEQPSAAPAARFRFGF